MSITTSKISTGFAVKLPFDLKDNFKETFKTAKWNPTEKQWEVGPRSGKRLEEWVKLASPLAEEIQKADEADLTEKEYNKIRLELTSIREELERERADKENFIVVCEKLKKAKDELADLKTKVKQERAEKQLKLEEVKEFMSEAISLDTIRSAHQTMIKHYNKNHNGSRSRTPFDQARTEIREEHEKLQSLGFSSEALAYLQYCNFNRPDRDNPNKIVYDDYFKIKAIDTEQ